MLRARLLSFILGLYFFSTYQQLLIKQNHELHKGRSQICLVYISFMFLYLQFTPKSHEGIPVINISLKEPTLSGCLAPSSWEHQAVANFSSSSSYQSSRSQVQHEEGETIMLLKESPGSFYCGSVPHEPHVKIELLGGLKIFPNLTVAERAKSLCSSFCYVTGKWLSSQRLHFLAPIASR